MKPADITHLRLRNQQIVATKMKTPAEVVAHFGAMQGQDFAGAKWSVGLRLPHATDADIEQAFAAKAIVRSWPMRSTLHFVAAQDIRWMTALIGPRIIAGMKGRYGRLELDEPTIARGTAAIMKALQGGKLLTRPELLAAVEKAGIATAGQRGIHMLMRACLEGLICQGSPVRGTAIFYEMATLPKTSIKTPEDASAELTRRYFASHGPATAADFAWWSSLKMSDVRAGMEMVKSEFVQETVDGQIYMMPRDTPSAPQKSPSMHLLPGFDEFLLAYKERGASLEPGHKTKWSPGNNGVFFPLIIIDGRVAGVWKRVLKKDKVIIAPEPFEPFSPAEKVAFAKEVERFAAFLGLDAAS